MLSPSSGRLVHFFLPFCLSSQPFQVELVWKRRWGLGTALFVFNRYSPFVESIISLSSESATCVGQYHLNICESPVFLPQPAGLCLSYLGARREPVAYIPHRRARNLQQFSHVSTLGGHLFGFSSLFFSTGFIVLGLLTSEFILMLRTYAIWDRSRKALYVLLATGTVRILPNKWDRLSHFPV